MSRGRYVTAWKEAEVDKAVKEKRRGYVIWLNKTQIRKRNYRESKNRKKVGAGKQRKSKT